MRRNLTKGGGEVGGCAGGGPGYVTELREGAHNNTANLTVSTCTVYSYKKKVGYGIWSSLVNGANDLAEYFYTWSWHLYLDLFFSVFRNFHFEGGKKIKWVKFVLFFGKIIKNSCESNLDNRTTALDSQRVKLSYGMVKLVIFTIHHAVRAKHLRTFCFRSSSQNIEKSKILNSQTLKEIKFSTKKVWCIFFVGCKVSLVILAKECGSTWFF